MTRPKRYISRKNAVKTAHMVLSNKAAVEEGKFKRDMAAAAVINAAPTLAPPSPPTPPPPPPEPLPVLWSGAWCHKGAL